MGFKITYISRFALVVASMFFLGSCQQDLPPISDVPYIELRGIEKIKDLNGLDSVLKITFYYQDGDGNLGLTDSDTFPPFNGGSRYQYNLWWDIKEHKNGQLIPILESGSTDIANFNLRIPDLRPTGKIKQISGEISVKVNAYSVRLYPDSIQCRLTLVDRALNESNTIGTEVITLAH